MTKEIVMFVHENHLVCLNSNTFYTMNSTFQESTILSYSFSLYRKVDDESKNVLRHILGDKVRAQQ